MNYGEIITSAFRITLHNRYLWFFGFFVGLGSGGGGGGGGDFDEQPSPRSLHRSGPAGSIRQCAPHSRPGPGGATASSSSRFTWSRREG